MAKLKYRTISKRTVEALPVEKDTVYWDRELTGFGVRVYPSGAKVYMVQSRGPNGLKRVTVGRHGVISADVARRRAAMMLTRIKAGGEPVPKPLPRAGDGPTVGDLAERYFREHVEVRCKPSTARIRRYVIGKHILPRFGNLPVSAIGREDVTRCIMNCVRRPRWRTTPFRRCRICSTGPRPGAWLPQAAIPAASWPSTDAAGESGS